MACERPDDEVDEKARAKKRRRKNPASDNFIQSDSDSKPVSRKRRVERTSMILFSYCGVLTLSKKQCGGCIVGLLFQVEFFRVILDEAQNIRNRKTSKLGALWLVVIAGDR